MRPPRLRRSARHHDPRGVDADGPPFREVFQFILYADNYIDDYLDLYRKGKLRESELVHRVTDKYIEFLRKGTGGMEVFMRTPIRNFRLFVALKLPSREKLGVELNYLDIYANASEILNGAMLYPRDVPPEDLVDWMRKIFNDKPSLNNKHYSPEIPLNRQVIFAESEILHNSRLNALQIGSRYFRCSTVKNYPRKVDAFQTNELFGGIWGSFRISTSSSLPSFSASTSSSRTCAGSSG